MGIVGSHPESGVRIDVERPRLGGPPWRYQGEAVTPGERLQLTAVVEAGGAVTVELFGDEPTSARSAVAEKVRLMMRAAWKHGQDDGAPPPRRIVRWRPEM